MDSHTEQNDLKKFLESVERGKKLHPGPFKISDWRRALNSEIFEAKNENCWDAMIAYHIQAI